MYHIVANSLNLKGKNANALDTVKSVFDRAGKTYRIHLTEHTGHAREIAAQLSADESDLHIVAMGGDGTLHEVLNGLKDPSACHLGFIPLGSGTDFAAAAGIPEDDVKYATEIIAFKAPSNIDYIQLSNGVRAVNSVGYGLDVAILKRAYAGKSTGKGKYYRAAVRTMLGYKPHAFKITKDSVCRKHCGVMACFGNGVQMGGGLKLFPSARIDDGKGNLLIVDRLSRLKTLLAFINLNMGKVVNTKEITVEVCNEATLQPDEEHYTIQADGELYEINSPDGITAKTVSGKLPFYLPKND